MRASVAAKRSGAWVGAVDAGPSAPVRFLVDRFWFVPRCSDPSFGETVFDLCSENGIGLVVPTIDTELPIYARNRDRFADAGTAVCISGERTIAIACDKHATSAWLTANGFPTVRQASPADVLAHPAGWTFPLIAKPHDGSASIGVRKLEGPRDLEYLALSQPSYIVQELARGREFTINLFVNRHGRCVCAVPHWRIEVRAGEVSKGLTVKDERLMDLGRRVVEALPDARGAMNLQCFLDNDGRLAIIEINARFGGGYPLAHNAGARFTDWLLDEQDGLEIEPYEDWTDNLAMLRFDDAVFVDGSSLKCPSPK